MPEVLGCAYVIPLNQMEYQQYYGMMKRDDESEQIAMQAVMDYEKYDSWIPEDISTRNLEYNIRSTSKEFFKRYIEVKGRSGMGGIMLSEK